MSRSGDRGVVELVVLVVAVGWVLVGLTVGLWMVRSGHDPRWAVIAVALGPIVVPIALERVERRPRSVASGPEATRGHDDGSAGGPRVLVGLDGSAESRQALAHVVDLLGPRCDLLVLAEVVDFDATEEDLQPELAAATERLTSATAAVSESGVDVRFEVLAGPPGEALRQLGEDQDVDMIVVGRRGRGLSRRLLGSVSSDLVRHSHVPVLVVEPATSTSTSDTGTTSAAADPVETRLL